MNVSRITQHYIERDGNRFLFRFAVEDAAVLDVLTDQPSLERVRELLLNAPMRGLTEAPFGTFGPFTVTVSTTNEQDVAIAVDGPDLGNTFQGNQAVVFYVTRAELLKALEAA